MSDADRLRAAAEVLDNMNLLVRMQQDDATAALLRAVADDDRRHSESYRLALVRAAARDLADVILGGSDE